MWAIAGGRRLDDAADVDCITVLFRRNTYDGFIIDLPVLASAVPFRTK